MVGFGMYKRKKKERRKEMRKKNGVFLKKVKREDYQQEKDQTNIIKNKKQIKAISKQAKRNHISKHTRTHPNIQTNTQTYKYTL